MIPAFTPFGVGAEKSWMRSGCSAGQRAKIRIHAYPDEEFEGVVETVGLASTSESNQRNASMSADQAKYYEAEILILRGSGSELEPVGPALFRYGFAFSIGLTLFPAVLMTGWKVLRVLDWIGVF